MMERHLHNPLQHSLQNPLVSEFLDRVCHEVRAKEMHTDIREELLGHLADRVEHLVDVEGKNQEEAIAEAIKQMGNPAAIGEGLHKVHRPKTDWGLLLLVGTMVIIAVVSLFTLSASYADHPLGDLLFPFATRIISGAAGISAMLVIAFINYRKLIRFSFTLYILTIGLMFISLLFGAQIHGSREWIAVGPIGFNVIAAAPYLLIIAAAGMLYHPKSILGIKKPISGKMILLKELVLLVLVPVFFFSIAPSLGQLLIYSLGLAILLAVSGRLKLLFAAVGSMCMLTLIVLWSTGGRLMYARARLTHFLQPDSDAGIPTKQSIDAISSAGMWGKGWGIPTESLNLRNISSEMLFPYLVQCLGWVFGAALVVIVLLFVGRMISLGRLLRDGYAKMLTIGLAGLFGVKFVWNIVMCLGLLPIMGFELPLMNWSSISIIEFGAVGLLLSIYRRKDMIPSADLTGDIGIIRSKRS
jgi:cell division protein FtsW (lipid II flippase)